MRKGSKSIIVAALLLSMTATAATPVCNASALNAADTAVATDALNLTYQEDGKTVRTIGGEISAAKIGSESDAKQILTGIADQLGVTDFDAQLRFIVKEESEINYSYVYQQYVGNVPLDSGFVTLVVNKETGKAVYLTSSFAADLEIGTTPAVSQFGARKIVKNVLGTDPDGIADLTIAKTQNGYQLAWLITNGQTDAFYVDALTGEIIKSMDGNYYYTKEFKYTQYNNVACRSNFTIPFETDDAQDGVHRYYIKYHDNSRNLYIVTSPFSAVNSLMSQMWGTTSDGKTYSNEQVMRSFPWIFDAQEGGGKLVIANMTTGDFVYNTSTYNGNQLVSGALFRVGQVYDFYKNNFSWYGIDNCGTNIYIAPYERHKNSVEVNAYSSTFGNLLGFGTNSNGLSMMADLDIVAHEYQHSVSNRKVKWGFSGYTGYTGETLIVDEGYADALGEYCDILQDNETASEWLGGNDALSGGNASDRAYIKNFKSELPSNLNYISNREAFRNQIEGHEGAKVLSHAAYLMHKYGIPDKYAAKIWFYSMDYLPKGADAATIYDWRGALSQASEDVLNNAYSNTKTRNLMKARVLIACNAVKVPAITSKLGDANGNCRLDSGDVTYLSQYLNNTRTLAPFALSLCDVNKDGNINNTDLNLLRNAVNNNGYIAW